jgi:CheY-like chemotaxis protein
MSILVVDDDRLVCEVITETLVKHGFAAEAAFGGAEAIERLRRPPQPTLVLLDLMMPPPDGNAVLRAVHAMDDPPTVVLVTGYNSKLEPDLFSVPIATLTKPVLPDEVVSAVHKYATKETST